MKILYAALRYDYGRPEQGPSFEHQTFYDTLSRLGHDLVYFDFDTLAKREGRSTMNRRLWEVAQTEEPDLMFCVLFNDELDQAVVSRISTELRTQTLNWFCDDHWRFYDFSRRWAPCFNWVVTTAPASVAPYEKHGLQNVIRSQWACNHFAVQGADRDDARYEVTFVGMDHGDRGVVIDGIRKAGIDIRTWGSGWPSGRLSPAEMVQVFRQSRINLNLADASVPEPGQAAPARRRPLLGRLRPSTLAPGPVRYIKQLKARTFEVTGSGGFLLTQEAPELDRYFQVGREVAVFTDTEDLVDKLRYYLSHEEERAAIAAAGCARVLSEHTYERRFDAIFSTMGLTA